MPETGQRELKEKESDRGIKRTTGYHGSNTKMPDCDTVLPEFLVHRKHTGRPRHHPGPGPEKEKEKKERGELRLFRLSQD